MPQSFRPLLRLLLPYRKQVPFLFLAAFVGAGGAFSALLFRSAFIGLQHLINGKTAGLVEIAEALP